MSFSTVIKIMVGGGVASETDAIETVQYSAEEIRAITSTCKQMGNRHTTAHAYVCDPGMLLRGLALTWIRSDC